MMVFGYLLLISTDFFRLFISVFSLVLVTIEKIYQTLKTVFDCISKHLKNRQKYFAVRRIFTSIGVLNCRGKTQFFVFHVFII